MMWRNNMFNKKETPPEVKEIDYKQRYEWALEDLVLFSKKITEQREMIVQLQKQLIALDNLQE